MPETEALVPGWLSEQRQSIYALAVGMVVGFAVDAVIGSPLSVVSGSAMALG